MKIERFNEKRTYKNHYKYLPILTRKYQTHMYSTDYPPKIFIYEENGKIRFRIDFVKISKDVMTKLCNDFRDYEYTLTSNYSKMEFNIDNLPKEFFNQLDIEIEAEKYNM